MASNPKIKQIQGLQSTLDALAGIDVIVESYTTTATDGDTGITLSLSARETDAIKIEVNGVAINSGISWKKDGSIITTDSLESGTELVWSSSTIGYDLSNDDEITITYETLTSGNTLVGNSGIEGTVTGNLIPDSDEAYDLGSPTNKFRDLYLSGNTLYMGGQPLSVVNGQLTLNGSVVSGQLDTKISSHTSTAASLNLSTSYYMEGNSNFTLDDNSFLTNDGSTVIEFLPYTGTSTNPPFNGGGLKFYDFDPATGSISASNIQPLTISNLNSSLNTISRFGASYNLVDISLNTLREVPPAFSIDCSADGKIQFLTCIYESTTHTDPAGTPLRGNTTEIVRYNPSSSEWESIFELKYYFKDVNNNLATTSNSEISDFYRISKDGNCIYSLNGTCLRWNGSTYVLETIFTDPSPSVIGSPDTLRLYTHIQDSYDSDVVIVSFPVYPDRITSIYRRDLSGNWISEYSVNSGNYSGYNTHQYISGDGNVAFISGNILRYINNTWVQSISPSPFSSTNCVLSYNGDRIIYGGNVYDYDSVNNEWDKIKLIGPSGVFNTISVNTASDSKLIDGVNRIRKSNNMVFFKNSHQFAFNLGSQDMSDQSGLHYILSINRPLNNSYVDDILFDPDYYDIGSSVPQHIIPSISSSYSNIPGYNFYFSDNLNYMAGDTCVLYVADTSYIVCRVLQNLNNILTVSPIYGRNFTSNAVQSNTYSVKPYYT